MWKKNNQVLPSPENELLQLADRLHDLYLQGASEDIQKPLQALFASVDQTAKSFSGSWLGYHSCVYYNGLQSPPTGAHFSKEWGLKDTYCDGTVGDWKEYSADHIRNTIYENADNPDLSIAKKLKDETLTKYKEFRGDVLSILSSLLVVSSDPYLADLKKKIEDIELLDASEIIQRLASRGQFMTRDSLALSQGTRVPPHIRIKAELIELHNAFAHPKELEEVARTAAKHIARIKYIAINQSADTCHIFSKKCWVNTRERVFMFFYNMTRKLWNDPVWSKVIAAGIIACIPILIGVFNYEAVKAFLNHTFSEISSTSIR
ncbi:MAG: hypothetical protein PHD48_11280 [Alphaproteobacteria bacterium]|nr:hypothetical protein [Alphaproteobacteria bacterium]